MDTSTFLRTRVEEAWYALTDEAMQTHASSNHQSARREVFIKLEKKTPSGWFSLNTNGASKGALGTAEGEGVLQDDKGLFVQGFAANCGVCTAYSTAANIGLCMAKELGIQKLIVLGILTLLNMQT